MNSTDEFLLTKWYLDCVTEEGVVFIGYVARMKIQRMVLHYSSILLHDKRTGTSSDTSLRKGRFPRIDQSRISWSSDSLSVEGEWNALSMPVERTWGTEPEGTIRWSCCQPLGRATVQMKNHRRMEGLGYVEQLTQTIPPWKLPFNELRWGHLLTESEAVVWIDWTGTTHMTMVVKNGVEVPNCTISDEEIHGDEDRFSLTLREKTVLRSGPLVSTALSLIPGISSLVSSRILNTHECKWLSRGQLLRSSLPPATGWAIHEVVRFQ
jgi:hypothetical protein